MSKHLFWSTVLAIPACSFLSFWAGAYFPATNESVSNTSYTVVVEYRPDYTFRSGGESGDGFLRYQFSDEESFKKAKAAVFSTLQTEVCRTTTP